MKKQKKTKTQYLGAKMNSNTFQQGIFVTFGSLCFLLLPRAVSEKGGTEIDYLCKEVCWETKEGENGSAPRGADRASVARRRRYLTMAQLSGESVGCPRGPQIRQSCQ